MKIFNKLKQIVCKHYFVGSPTEIFRNEIAVKYAISCNKCDFVLITAFPNSNYAYKDILDLSKHPQALSAMADRKDKQELINENSRI